MVVKKTNIEDVFLINFSDLIPEVQKQLLDFMGIEDPAELNWDVFPLAEVTKSPEKAE